MTNHPEPLLTPKDAAGILRLDIETVWRLLRRGELRASRVGGRWRIRRADLDRYLEERANRPAGLPEEGPVSLPRQSGGERPRG